MFLYFQEFALFDSKYIMVLYTSSNKCNFFFLSSKYNRILWIFSPFYNWFFSLFFSSGTTIIAMETKAGAAVAEAMVVATTQVGEVTARVVMAVEVEEVGVVDTVVTSKISVLMFNHQILLCVFFF